MTIADLRYYAFVLFHRLPILLLVAGSVSAAGIAYALSLPPVYRATSTIRVEMPLVTVQAREIPGQVAALARLQVLQQELFTRRSLLELADRNAIYTETVPPPDRMADDLRSRITFEPILFAGDQNALGFGISFDAENPELAARVSNDLADVVLQRDHASRSAQSEAALEFYRQEAARLEQEVKTTASQLQAYKTEHVMALPDTLEFRRLLQVNLQERILTLQREQADLHSRRANYLEYYRQTGTPGGSAEQTPEQAQLAQMKMALSQQRLTFAEGSPALLSLARRIEQLEAQLASNVASTETDGRIDSALNLQLTEIDDRLRAIAEEIASAKASDSELATSIEATPANETVLNDLERQHNMAQTLFDAALNRLAEASASEKIDAAAKGERLTLLEPALPPHRAIGPKRSMIAFAGGGAGLLLGLLVVMGPLFLSRTPQRSVEIERKLGIEVLASIPEIPARIPLRHLWKRLWSRHIEGSEVSSA